MIDRLIKLLAGEEQPSTETASDDLELAVAALLVEAAHMDTAFDATERSTIERLLAERFELDHGAVQALIAEAERKVQAGHQLFPFTNEICKQLSPEVRIEIIEMLWRVSHADGHIEKHEEQLIQRIAGLLHVSDRDRVRLKLKVVVDG